MAFSVLRMFQPYSGDAASSVGGRGNGAANRVVVWANGTDITSFANFTYDGGSFTVPGTRQYLTASDPGAVSAQIINSNTGAGAFAQLKISSDAGDMVLNVNSIAAGDSVNFTADSTFSGGLTIGILGSNPLGLYTSSTLRLGIAGAGAVTIGGDGETQTHRINISTQSTVGAAGGASALPATPTGYLLINVNGTNRAVPYYAAS